MNNFTPHLIGQIVSVLSVTVVLSIITLTLLYVGIPFFGPITDIPNAIGCALIAIMAWHFHFLLRKYRSDIAVYSFWLPLSVLPTY